MNICANSAQSKEMLLHLKNALLRCRYNSDKTSSDISYGYSIGLAHTARMLGAITPEEQGRILALSVNASVNNSTEARHAA